MDGAAATDLQVTFLLPANSTGPSMLDVAVHALGRFNFGCVWDTKGLQNRGQLESGNVTLNGTAATTCLHVQCLCHMQPMQVDHLEAQQGLHVHSQLRTHRSAAAGLACVAAAAGGPVSNCL